MPTYTYRCEHTGRVQEMIQPMSEAVPIGAVITIGDVQWRRLADSMQLSRGIASTTHGYPYTAKSLPRNIEGATSNSKGQPIITSRKHEREVQARHGLERD